MQKLVLIFLYSVVVFSGLFTVATLFHSDWSDFLILAASVCAASLFLLLKLLAPRIGRASRATTRVVVDGSNVLYWKNNTPDPEPLCDVAHRLQELGYAPHIFFDANAGYLLVGRYLGDREFEKVLGLPRGLVTVVPKGTIADQEILRAALKYKCQIVTNDRYRDWAEQYPNVKQPGFLQTGRYRSGELVLTLEPVPA